MPKSGNRRKIKEMLYGDFKRFLKSLGYVYDRTRGSSHHIFKNPNTNKKVSIVSKHGRTVHPKSIIISLHELGVSTSTFCDWLENNV